MKPSTLTLSDDDDESNEVGFQPPVALSTQITGLFDTFIHLHTNTAYSVDSLNLHLLV